MTNLKRQVETNVKCQKILRERGVEAVKTILYAFKDFSMFNCASKISKTSCIKSRQKTITSRIIPQSSLNSN